MAADFHTKCEGKAKTITIVKTTDGNTIGGYTSVAWTTPGENTRIYDD